MTEGARCIFALLVCGAFTVLAAVEFDSQLSQPGILTCFEDPTGGRGPWRFRASAPTGHRDSFGELALPAGTTG
jgi:hypothetical protein